VGALAQKMALPTRVKDKVHDAKETAQSKVDTVTNQALAKFVPSGVGRIKGQRIKHVTGTVRRRPVPVAVAVLSVLMLLGLIIRRNR
jgi:hypothetical protein